MRAWIIGHGRAAVDRIAADPDALVEPAHAVDSVNVGEELGMIVREMGERLTRDCGGESRSTGVGAGR
ncbi:hypothetical protein ACIBQ1_51460 [Nonomuraea sp. NPDC050153]|uniref:hypothetical protein n=1 Tax=Nonomuraea sp. NPDC050153 TaxID=3364359 RepID=UPI0037A3F863